MLFAEGNPGGIKYVLQLKGICENHVRLPLVDISR
jgi:4-hydroxy-tetrahydrodipicolinate synthase